MKLRGLSGRDQAKIVFGVLKIVFGRDGIAAGMRVARQLQVFLRDVMSIATNFDVRPVGFV
jgi:hypothetical protein